VSAHRYTPERPLAIIGAMVEEVEPLRTALIAPMSGGAGPWSWQRGELDGVSVLVAVCGIGKVNAAALTQALLHEGAAAVLFTGVAGAVAASLQVGDLVVAEDAMQHDVDVRALGYALGQVPGEPLRWEADPELRKHLLRAAEGVAAAEGLRALLGRVVSGDAFIADPERVLALRRDFAATCAEMEGAAVAQVCARWGVPWAIVRSISDTADHSAQVDFRALTSVAAQRAVAVVRRVLGALAT
jgi:adenosylhomocysteine nucleosidase